MSAPSFIADSWLLAIGRPRFFWIAAVGGGIPDGNDSGLWYSFVAKEDYV